MADNKNVLGKGLGSLIPSKDGGRPYWGPTMGPPVSGEQVLSVPVEAIRRNPWQPRKNFDQAKLNELAASIREHGIVQPLIATQSAPGEYQLIAGERRLIAAKQIGISRVPVIVREAADQKKLELSLIENLQRHDLNPVEEAVSYRRLMDEFNLTQEEVAQRVGRSRSAVANFVRLLNLPREILEALEQGAITFSHAKNILSYDSPAQQLKIFREIIRKGLTVAQIVPPQTATRRQPRMARGDVDLVSWEQRLTARMGFPVRIQKSPSGGTIRITASTDEDLKALMDDLLGA